MTSERIKLFDHDGTYTDEGGVYSERMKQAIDPIVKELITEKGATVSDVVHLITGLHVWAFFHAMKKQS